MICIKCWVEFDSKYRVCQDCYDKFKQSNPRDYTLLVNKDTPKIDKTTNVINTQINIKPSFECKNLFSFIFSPPKIYKINKYITC